MILQSVAGTLGKAISKIYYDKHPNKRKGTESLPFITSSVANCNDLCIYIYIRAGIAQ